ncbi:hypothetical protein JB92DRAFT_3192678 [Gautieria morchelliformis]|nr:hypothetical protein JB92DRAFT_3192678 [Gautieria morchelliformis]
MTVLNFTFQDLTVSQAASPLINYTGMWTEGSLTDGYNGSFRVTQAANASASFLFVAHTGTAVSLFGTTRPDHGSYTVDVDQLPQFIGSGFSGVNESNSSLSHEDNLGYTQHTVTLTNVPVPNQPFLDLDFVSIERQIGQTGDNIFQATLDDTSLTSVHYVGAWSPETGVSSAHQGTLHSTKTANAQVNITFQGSSVEIYGQYANAPYTVTLDNQEPDSFQGLGFDLASNLQYPQTLLYLADGLSENVDHTVALTNSNSDGNRPFIFDFAVVRSTHNLTAATPISDGSSKHHTAVGTIVGGVLGALALIAVLGISAIILVRRRRRRGDGIQMDLIDDEMTYVVPYDVNFNAPLPPVPSGDNPIAPSSKVRPAVHHRVEQSIDSGAGPSSIEPSEISASSSTHVHTRPLPKGLGASGAVPSSQAVSTSSKDAQRRAILQRDANGEDSQESAREEDAGVVLDPEEVPASTWLPPAYNPDWDHN